MKKFIIITLIALAAIVLFQDFLNNKKKHTPIAPRPYVVMLSLDGFRWDYDTKTSTPNFDYLAKNGVKAEGLQPSFPSKTFPNHYSIATGLHPGNHGLISNSFYAPDLNQYYSIGDRSKVENGEFYKGEPIWVTAEAQRVKTASYFWVGTEAKIKGYLPSYNKIYDHSFPYEQRVDSVINWLQMPYSERPHLVTWYIDRSDGIGHEFGPDSPEIVETVGMLDSLIGVFISKLNKLPIKDSVNFIIVSDHGMGSIQNDKIVYLNEYLNDNWIDTTLGANPFTLIYPKKNYKDSIYKYMQNVEGITTWKKEDILDRFHLKQNERMSEIVVVADSGWSTALCKDSRTYNGGTHGYDNLNKDMHGIFFGVGPSFKSDYTTGTLINTDIYNLIARILEIKPAPNDGEPDRIMHILKEENLNMGQ